MKLRHASVLACAVAVVAAVASCNQPQRRNDWRSPSPPAMTAPNEQPPYLPTDGGAPPGPPGGPIVQPSASDIQL